MGIFVLSGGVVGRERKKLRVNGAKTVESCSLGVFSSGHGEDAWWRGHEGLRGSEEG
jgi:hypothetical protein